MTGTDRFRAKTQPARVAGALDILFGEMDR